MNDVDGRQFKTLQIGGTEYVVISLEDRPCLTAVTIFATSIKADRTRPSLAIQVEYWLMLNAPDRWFQGEDPVIEHYIAFERMEDAVLFELRWRNAAVDQIALIYGSGGNNSYFLVFDEHGNAKQTSSVPVNA